MGEVIERGAEAVAAGAIEAAKEMVTDTRDEAKKVDPEIKRAFSWGWLKAKTGAGEVEEYLAAPANILGGRAGAQLARGIEGLTGGAKLAVLDIVLGLVGWVKAETEKKRAQPTPEKGESPPVHGA